MSKDTTISPTDAPTTDHRPTERQRPLGSESERRAREMAALMHVSAGLEECDVIGCDREAEPVQVVDADADTGYVLREGVRCSDHEKDFLEVSS